MNKLRIKHVKIFTCNIIERKYWDGKFNKIFSHSKMSICNLFNKVLFFYIINNNFFILINLRLFIKLGIRPFHSWFISILKTSSLNTLFILSTIQKIIPLIIIFNIKVNNILIFSIILFTLVFILRLLPSTININKVLALSSINNIIWLIMRTLLSLKIMLLFIIIYIYIILGVVRIYNFYRLNVFYQINSIIFLDKFIILIVFISLGGIPPMLGFLRKIIILKIIINNSLRVLLIFTIVISSLTLLYFYLSRMYFYLTNIPSLKINFKLTPFSIKIIYIISLLYINLAFSIYI